MVLHIGRGVSNLCDERPRVFTVIGFGGVEIAEEEQTSKVSCWEGSELATNSASACDRRSYHDVFPKRLPTQPRTLLFPGSGNYMVVF
jgi:hypothetical protein